MITPDSPKGPISNEKIDINRKDPHSKKDLKISNFSSKISKNDENSSSLEEKTVKNLDRDTVKEFSSKVEAQWNEVLGTIDERKLSEAFHAFKTNRYHPDSKAVQPHQVKLNDVALGTFLDIPLHYDGMQETFLSNLDEFQPDFFERIAAHMDDLRPKDLQKVRALIQEIESYPQFSFAVKVRENNAAAMDQIMGRPPLEETVVSIGSEEELPLSIKNINFYNEEKTSPIKIRDVVLITLFEMELDIPELRDLLKSQITEYQPDFFERLDRNYENLSSKDQKKVKNFLDDLDSYPGFKDELRNMSSDGKFIDALEKK